MEECSYVVAVRGPFFLRDGKRSARACQFFDECMHPSHLQVIVVCLSRGQFGATEFVFQMAKPFFSHIVFADGGVDGGTKDGDRGVLFDIGTAFGVEAGASYVHTGLVECAELVSGQGLFIGIVSCKGIDLTGLCSCIVEGFPLSVGFEELEVELPGVVIGGALV